GVELHFDMVGPGPAGEARAHVEDQGARAVDRAGRLDVVVRDRVPIAEGPAARAWPSGRLNGTGDARQIDGQRVAGQRGQGRISAVDRDVGRGAGRHVERV